MANSNYKPLLEVTRGPIVESIHYGAIAIVDANGRLLASHGNPDTLTFMRSSAKPFQALAFLELGGAEAFNLIDREIALLCASHSGTDEHLAVLEGIQRKIGISERDLLCGTHTPFHKPTALKLHCRGEKPTPNRHNCSGKHTGMLAHAKLLDLPFEDYPDPKHPLQQQNLRTFAEMCNLEPEQVIIGIDGCSVPTFAIPLRSAALAYARLCDPSDLSERRADQCRRITRSMTDHPDMVAGPERFDTQLMRVGAGKIVAKIGAEGYFAIGLPPGVLAPESTGIGITIKISDGDLKIRCRPIVAVEVLRQLGVLSTEQLKALAEFDRRPVLNWRNLEIGAIRPYFILEKPS